MQRWERSELDEQQRPGPKHGLSVEQVVDEAFGILADGGVTGFSMRKLASELGVTTMALYTYLPSRDALMEHLADECIGRCPGRSAIGRRLARSSARHCDLAIKGLEGAGQNHTRQGFIDAIRAIHTYDQAGLSCQPVGIGLDTFGKPPATQCSYFLIVKGGKFVPMFNGKPIVGKIVGSPDALKAAQSGAGAVTATTTQAPSPSRSWL
jgi:hypothetical protein